jgi:ATP-dependent helicase/nuclease subunit B
VSLFAAPGPRWFNIPADRRFLDDLARGVFAALTPLGPEALSDATVLVPNRRAARGLARAFGEAAGGRALLLPQIRALGDLDEGEPPFEPGDLALDLPPAITPWRRRFELARLAAAHGPKIGRELDAVGALELGDALGAFFDSLEIEEATGRDLGALAEGDFADHWRLSADFLDLAVSAWPARLAELGLADVTARRVELLNRLSQVWTERPPQGPIIAAGSTGSAPATARLLAVIAGLPQGCVVLPGLDQNLSDEAWDYVEDQHPQGAMKRLLSGAGVDRKTVALWPVAPDMAGHWRRRVINEALRPAERTADWLRQIADMRKVEGPDPIAEGLSGLSTLTARTEDEAAAVCAVLLRETLETPGATAALVTPDQMLARRVSARLSRWGVAVDSSTGAPLAECPVGVLLSLLTRAFVDPLEPATLLALLKHPLTRLGLDGEALARARERLEEHGLRGARARDWATLEARLEKQNDEAAGDLAVRLRIAVALGCEPARTPADAARALAAAAEAFAAGPDGKTGALWAGAGGEAAAGLLAALIEDGAALPPASPRGFHALIERLLMGETIRVPGAVHARIQILGALEARLVGADRLILAGLEEGVWPPNAPTDPFLSRPMRKSIGLPPPERRIGLSAHDFAQAACAGEVYLLHTERRAGQPSVKSRWLWRLETLARGAGVDLAARDEVVDWARRLDAPGPVSPAPRPAPTPPVADRPRKMAVTRIEALTRDPYAVWARDILKLFPLERPDEAVDVRARGTAIHEAFEKFTLAWPRDLPLDAADRFKALYLEELVAAGAPRSALAREQALANEAAAWIVEWEHRRRAGGTIVEVEKEGRLTFDTAAGPFVLTARTDRIELTRDGRAHILDYKTGKAPSEKMVKTGFSPQLTLTAAIVAHGVVEGVPPGTQPGELTYIEITGRKPAGREEVRVSASDSLDAANTALNGAIALIRRYDDEKTPYRSRTAPQFVKTYAGDYDHLARVFEWSTAGDDDGGEA